MFKEFINYLSYTFVLRALIVGALVSLCSALLGVSLVLKKYSMIGDGLSHVGFGALAFAAALSLSPLIVAVPVVIIAAFFLLRINNSSKIEGDSAIAIISTTSIALGTCIVTVTGTNIDLSSYLFGSILSLSDIDTYVSIILSVCVILLFFFMYNKIFAVTFDEDFAKATGTYVSLFNTIIAVLTAITVVLGMRMMGTLLISCIIIFPPITAMRLFKTFKSVCIFSAVISCLAFFIGFFFSCTFGLPTGATVVIVNAILLLFAIVRLPLVSLIKRLRKSE